MTDVFADLPRGHFGAIVADPPWNFATYSDKGRDRCPDAKGPMSNDPVRHYATMSLDDIKALPVATLAARDCVLLLWVVDSMLPQALEVGAAWGFTYKTVGFYWAKLRRVTSSRGDDQDDPYNKLFPMGTGYWTRTNPEQCLLLARGKPKRASASVRKLVVSPRREHSRKPDEILGYVESLVPGPYLELFARTQRPGWHSWGNETAKFNAPSVSQTAAFEDLVG